MDEYIKVKDLVDMLEQRMVFEEKHGYHSEARRINTLIDDIGCLPTADVVPKSEVDRLEYTLLGVMHSVDKWLDGDELKQDEVNRAITMREKTLRIIENAKTEVAREIFDEIEKIAMHGTTPFGLCLMSIGVASFTELKKKYTVSNSEQRTDTKQTPLSPNKRDIDTKALLSDLKKAVHDKAIYTYSKELAPYVNLKVFDAVIADYLRRLEEKRI